MTPNWLRDELASREKAKAKTDAETRPLRLAQQAAVGRGKALALSIQKVVAEFCEQAQKESNVQEVVTEFCEQLSKWDGHRVEGLDHFQVIIRLGFHVGTPFDLHVCLGLGEDHKRGKVSEWFWGIGVLYDAGDRIRGKSPVGSIRESEFTEAKLQDLLARAWRQLGWV
jgi:hypothetical protein